MFVVQDLERESKWDPYLFTAPSLANPELHPARRKYF